MNIYSALDDSDEEETPKVVAPKKVKEAPAAAPAKKEVAGAKKEVAPKVATKAVDDSKPKGKGENTVPANKNKETKSTVPVIESEASGKEDNRGGHARGRDKSGRGGRGRGGGGYSDGAPAAEGEEVRRPKREFERRSGTGRGREVSKGGRGAFGAGNAAQDALEAEKDPLSAEVPVEGLDGEEAAADAEPVVVAEPEPVTYTLDEYMRKREEARQQAAGLIGATKPTRSVDAEKEFAGLTSFSASLSDYLPGNAKAVEAGKKDQRSTGKTQVTDVGFKFQVPQQDSREGGRGGRGEGGRGGRGGEGRGRGGDRREGGRGEGRGRGGGRDSGARPSSRPASGPSSTVFNTKDFPSL